VSKFFRLLADGLHHLRICVPEIHRADAAGEIDKDVAIDVGDERAFGFRCKNRRGIIRPTRHRGLPALHKRLTLGAGDGGFKVDGFHAFFNFVMYTRAMALKNAKSGFVYSCSRR
jgi:hypothetical protein